MPDVGQVGIVGRSGPLQRLGEAMAASAQGRRSATLVSGEAGIGKTSLVRSAIEASTVELVVGWGTCWPGGGAPGFWPWMQVFADLARSVGSQAVREAAGPDRDLLSVLVRDLGPVGEASGDPEGNRLLLLDAAVRWLEALTVDRHIGVVLDDLQWADPSTLDLFDHVLASPVTARLMLVGAYRHNELDGETRPRVARLASRADHVHLDGLTVEAVEELVGAIGGPAVSAAALHRRTGGHPLFVSELARLSDEDGDRRLPSVVTDAVGRRIDALPEETRRTLESASVLGNRLLPDVLATVDGEALAVIIDRLSPAIDAGVLRTTAQDGTWFAHDLFREALYDRLDATQRSLLHGLVADALAERSRRGGDVPPSDLARHYAKAATSRGGKGAIHWARQAAADERRRSAFTEAAGHLLRARQSVVDAGCSIEPDVLVRLLIEEAGDRARSGDPDGARSLLAGAAKAAPDPARQADVALAVQRLGAKFAAPRDAIIGQLETALEAVTGLDLAREARLTAALARELQHSVSGDRARAGPLSERAIVLGRRSNDDETLAACLLARHDGLWGPGTGAERAQLGHEIATVGSRLGATDCVAEGLLLEANGLLESGSAGFRPVLARWLALLDARDEPRDRYMTATRRAALALLDGDTGRAETLMEEAARIGERIHEPDTGNVLMSQRVALARARDDPDELRALAGDAVRWWTGSPVLAYGVAAGAYTAAGDLVAAGRAVATVAACGGWQSEGSYLRSVLVSHLAEAATALGDHELCRDLLTDIEHLTDSCGVNGAIVAFAGPFAHTAGILAGGLGDLRTADAMLRQSVATARRLGAEVWVRQGTAALETLSTDEPEPANRSATRPTAAVASLTRSNGVWSISWRAEHAHLPHLKGLADIATLVRLRGQEVPALQLAGGASASAGASDQLIDRDALHAYRQRLNELAVEIDRAADDADLGRVQRLQDEREHLLAEVGRATGLGGRLRNSPNDPAERARKAVTARIRDVIGRLATTAPVLAAHLDRSIRTGLRCSYVPLGEDAEITWEVHT
ncbi:MAG: AAA family ATPase [Nitriliruptor sp.]|uniref:ATP-binding protein n=1 Tax=Nitriliruptor sp. TaxID=2448056 RepID=UPI0034A0604D